MALSHVFSKVHQLIGRK